MKLKLKGLYMYTGGFYTYSIFALIYGVESAKGAANVVAARQTLLPTFCRHGLMN
ncbi:hypothetical protein HanPSC8_Chr00c704g0809511 [Helianthus annuus]|nr:hypothetical protein HanPSC8_Chr00c704g0809511 [Helianthus annuus]